MYNKLPVKERIELMKSYRKANKDMSYHDMVKDYNDSYQKFENGGYKSEAEYKAHLLDPYSVEKKAAQIAWLNNNKPITYREDFKPGMLSNIPGLSSLASGNQFGLNRYEMYGPLGDLYRYYGGQPLAHNVLVESKNKPSNSKDKNAKYISLNNDPTFVNEILDNYKRVSSGNLDKGIENKLSNNSWAVSGYSSAGPNAHKTTKQGSEYHSNAIGRYTLSKGTDEKGDYISYYDKFDQGTGSGINPGEMLGLTKPFEIYDRIYIDSKTGKPIVQHHKYGGIQKFGDGGTKNKPKIDFESFRRKPSNSFPTSQIEAEEMLKQTSKVTKQTKYQQTVKNPNIVDTYESSFIPSNYNRDFPGKGKDTTIDLTKNDLSFGRIGEVVKGNNILGGDFIWKDPTAYYAIDYKKHPENFKNPGHPSGLNNATKDYYGIENKKLKIGKINDFNDSTVVVPSAHNVSYKKATVTESKEEPALANLYNPSTVKNFNLQDSEGKNIKLALGTNTKAILHSPKTGAQEFVYADNPYSLMLKLNTFKSKNPDAMLLQIDNGRYHNYLTNKKGLTKKDFENYGKVDKLNAKGVGYNLIATPKK